MTILLGAIGGLAAGRRHRDHEHHARVRERADARDRHPDGGRRAPARHHVAVPGRGAPLTQACGRRQALSSASACRSTISWVARGPTAWACCRRGRRSRVLGAIGVFFGYYPARTAPRCSIRSRPFVMSKTSPAVSRRSGMFICVPVLLVHRRRVRSVRSTPVPRRPRRPRIEEPPPSGWTDRAAQ